MTKNLIIEMIKDELKKAKEKHPVFYKDIIHAVSVMVEEAGESLQAALDYTYLGGNEEKIIKELCQTGAMVFRILLNIEKMIGNEHYLYGDISDTLL